MSAIELRDALATDEREALQELIAGFRLANWTDDMGDGLPLVDRITSGSDIGEGVRQIELLADEIACFYAALSAPAPAPTDERPLVLELPDDLRVPLDELAADARYLAARLANGTMSPSVGADAIKKKLAAIRAAVQAVLYAAPQASATPRPGRTL